MAANAIQNVIPLRVDLKKAIEIAQSQLDISGRGLFAKEDVKAGELIFCIPQPLIVSVDPKIKTEICDSCFAIKSPPTVPVTDDLKFPCCSKCKEAYYCDKECQKAAWKHHHKEECRRLTKLKGITIDDVELLDLSGIRGLVRLLALFRGWKLSREEQSEFLALQTNRTMREKDKYFAAMMEVETGLIWSHIAASNSQELVKDFYCAMGSNQLRVVLPVLQGSRRINEVERPLFVVAGTCLEPFVALLNHSCVGNSVWAFEGCQLRVRARTDIVAGEELTISYTNSGRDYHQRNEELLQNYGFICTCALCKLGYQEGNRATPTGYLRQMLLNLIDAGKPNTLSEIREVEVAIAMLKSAGFGHDKYPMRPLHLMILSGFIKIRNYNIALKTALILYYFIEPTQTPPTSREERLDTLHYLIQLIEWQDSPLTLVAQILRTRLHLHLREKYVIELDMCYGADSTVAKFERRDFETAVATMLDKFQWKFVSMMQSKEEREMFFLKMNELLRLADLPARKMEELFWEE